ncbi:MAG: hypothetical protein AAF547_06240 [Actinomycetota bacterium]
MKLDASTGWPTYDRRRRHIRTPSGSFIPFAVIQRVAAVAALILGIEITYGMTNWITIPVALATLAWAIAQVEAATFIIRAIEYNRRTSQKEPDA